jgi:hypothetical protein
LDGQRISLGGRIAGDPAETFGQNPGDFSVAETANQRA